MKNLSRGKKLRHGFTLIEMMITLAVFAILIMVGLPSLTTWLQNSQIRTAAETMQMGLQLARAEALRRNQLVRFQLVDSLGSCCALSETGTSWVINMSQADATGACDQVEWVEQDLVPANMDRQILQKRSGAEGTRNATVESIGGAKYVKFNGLGRVSRDPGVDPITQIDIRNSAGGACQDKGGPMRCLR